MKSKLYSVVVSSVLQVSSLAACEPAGSTGATVEASPASRISDEIVSGDPPGPLAYRLGAVFLGNCSGTLITNRHVLTAAHCAPFPASVSFATPLGTQVLSVTAAMSRITTGAQGAYDFAVLTLGTAAVVDGASDTLNHRLDPALAVGMPVSCLGFGCNTRSYGACFGAGVLRRAEMSITGIAGMIETRRNSRGQVANSGDSGSSCHLASDSGDTVSTSLIGVESYVYYDIFDSDAVVTAHYTPPWTTKAWVESLTMSNVSVSLSFRAPALVTSLAPIGARVETSGHTEDVAGLAGQVLTAPRSVPRSGRFTVRPRADGYACRPISGTGPMDGSLELDSVCVGLGAIFAAL
ncbi:MAG: trypsin-like serine protease [Myxococcaceae bacterium]|nr:trypsin-like serine protease [Myxococcaceae bacterium]